MKPLHRQQLTLILAAAVAAAACSDARKPNSIAKRNHVLDQAFAAAGSDPSRAAGLFADAGPGPSLEHSRMAVWADCLERIGAGVRAWRRYLEDRPPETLAARARLNLIQVLIDDGATVAALDERSLLSIDDRPRADELLLTVDDPAVRLEAARRLAFISPPSLNRFDRDLDRRVAATLSPREIIDRARAWRRNGEPARAASELRRPRWQEEDERRRRRELARAELAAGSPARALRSLPSARNAEAADHVLRSEAFRNRGWHLFPGRGEERLFGDCVTAAESAIATDTSGEHRQRAHVLRLECATQAGMVKRALESWRVLEAGRWDDSRRDWLGRRLGLSLARIGGHRQSVLEMARSLPLQERSLRYWMAVGAPDGRAELAALAGVSVADLYGQWSREALARPPISGLEVGSPTEDTDPPRSVQRLLDAGSTMEALRQWRRIRHTRLPTPAEAVAAAELASTQGLPTDAIRWLLAGCPELGTVDMSLAPEDAVRAYLPLRWDDAVAAAAREAGLDPWLIAAVARQESGFAAHAVSPQGAIGVLQLLPSTARLHARALGFGPQPDLRDPGLNLRLGARELSALLRRFGALEPALAAYNGGLTRVRAWWKRWPERHRFVEEIPIPETYNYVRRVVYLSEAYRLVYDDIWRSTP